MVMNKTPMSPIVVDGSPMSLYLKLSRGIGRANNLEVWL